MHAQVNKVDGIHAIEQQKQTSDDETRVSSLSPDPAGRLSLVDSAEARFTCHLLPVVPRFAGHLTLLSLVRRTLR